MSDAVFTSGQAVVDSFYHQPFKLGYRIGDTGFIFSCCLLSYMK